MVPLFSIITICYNAADELERTIRNIDSQSFKSYEHVIIDGASKDRTIELLKASITPQRRYISEPDGGIYDAMNKGQGMANGDYLIFMNAGDCFYNSDTLEVYADVIKKNNYPGIVYGQTILVDKSGHRVGYRHLQAPERLTLKSFANGMLVCHQAMAVLRRIAPLYNLKYRFSADYEWVIKCLQHSKNNIYVGQVTCNYLSEGATTAHRGRSLYERFKIMCRYYGTLPTIFRHMRFAIRFIRTRR